MGTKTTTNCKILQRGEVKGQRSQQSCLKLRVISVKADGEEEEEEEDRERWRMQKDQQGGDRNRRMEK